MSRGNSLSRGLRRASSLKEGESKPSQALPRQLPRRGSQAVTFVAEVLGAMRNLYRHLKKLPLSGELARRQA